MFPKLSLKNVGSGLFSLLLGAVFAFLTYALVFKEVPMNNRDAMLLLLGIVSTNIGQITSYYFGSSASSRAKDETISKMTKGDSQ